MVRTMLAFVREVAPALARCELSFLPRVAIDIERAREQHAEYVAALTALGCRIEWLPPLPDHPDGVFVEDTAVIVPGLAAITRPGVPSRRAEVASVARALSGHLTVQELDEPACLEGGDVLRIGRVLHVGASGRTNAAGIAQLAAVLHPRGYRVQGVAMRDCLHMKSACTFIPPDTLLVNPAWVDPAEFGAARVIAVDPREAFGANTLTVSGVTLVSRGYPRTEERLAAAGIRTRALDVSELHKAEAALTCLSLLIESSPHA